MCFSWHSSLSVFHRDWSDGNRYSKKWGCMPIRTCEFITWCSAPIPMLIEISGWTLMLHFNTYFYFLIVSDYCKSVCFESTIVTSVILMVSQRLVFRATSFDFFTIWNHRSYIPLNLLGRWRIWLQNLLCTCLNINKNFQLLLTCYKRNWKATVNNGHITGTSPVSDLKVPHFSGLWPLMICSM